MTSISSENFYWYDHKVIEWFNEYGAKKFRREAIWEVDWVQLANNFERYSNFAGHTDPRNRYERYVHQWLRKTQGFSTGFTVRAIEKGLKRIGW